MAELEGKRIFLIASPKPDNIQGLIKTLEENIKNATIFTATDGVEVLFKVENVPPHVVILDADLTKMNSFEVAQKLLDRKEKIAVILIAPPPDTDRFVDEIVTGQVGIITPPISKKTFVQHLNRALNWVAHGDDLSGYHLRFLGPNEIFLRQGDVAESVFLVKSGSLKAYKNEGPDEVVLGQINSGEFVGEMAYIQGDTRLANVKSLTACELIEIPVNNLDSVLFSKPAWAKALMKTLSMRLKKANEEKAT